MVFLHSHGAGTARAVRIFKAYGSDAIQVMTENPYIRFGSGACCPVGIYSYAASASETGAYLKKCPVWRRLPGATAATGKVLKALVLY
jgi:helix-hairpin-helix protein